MVKIGSSEKIMCSRKYVTCFTSFCRFQNYLLKMLKIRQNKAPPTLNRWDSLDAQNSVSSKLKRLILLQRNH